MAVPLRTKRNFKSLQIPVEDPLPISAPPAPAPAPAPRPLPPAATRIAPAGPQPQPTKRRPPPLEDGPQIQGFLSPSSTTARSSLPPHMKNNPRASTDSTILSSSTTNGGGTHSGRHSAIHATLAKIEKEQHFHAAPVEISDLKNADLKNLAELGQGNGGSVMKVEHVPSGTVMAKKIVLIDAKPTIRKQILRELQIMHSCQSPFIVSSYGAFLAEPNICICMEFMDKGSFDGIYKKIGAIDIEVVGRVAHAVLEGLMYLYDVHRIIHRDIKPSNILCNSQGEIKLCDFGVSGELINSIAHTFVGTSIYMSPERIQGAEYSVKSDVWSLGISLVELALGRFPFSDASLSDDEDDSDLEGMRMMDNGVGDGDEGGSGEGEGGERLSKNGNTDYHKTAKQLIPPLPSSTSSGSSSSNSPLSSKTAKASENAAASGSGSGSAGPSAALASSSSSSKRSSKTTTTTMTTITTTTASATASATKRRKSKGVSLHGDGGMTMSIIELMHQIVKEPAPRLGPEGRFPREAEEFVMACLLKDPEERKMPRELSAFKWMEEAQQSTFDLKEWASTF